MTNDNPCCYYCGSAYPVQRMRLLVTPTGKGWRCPRCIESARAGADDSQAQQKGFDEPGWQARFADALAGNTYA